MIENSRLLALVVARGGSKRLPHKNVLDLAGKPVIAWTIEAGKKSKYVDRVVVSTDDEEIAKVSKLCGADVPFRRPEELAGDRAKSVDVVRHAIDVLKAKDDIYEFCLLLQPTSPLRTAEHIDAAVELLLEKKADSILSVSKTAHPVEWVNTLPKDLSMDGFFCPEFDGMRSQDFPDRYQVNGAIYINRISSLLQSSSLINCGKAYAYIMSQECSVDIDDYVDYLLAGVLLGDAQKSGKSINR
jgi:CMP-N,N'-diacetyllegionaminic acid synthase